MAQPQPYDRQFNFADQQAQTPSTPLPAQEVDAEFNAVKLTLDQTLTNLAKVQRDDGALKNGIVTQDSLSPSLSIGFTFRGVWVEGVNYLQSDGVSVDAIFYRARVSHLSTAETNPEIDPSTWEAIANITPIAIDTNSIYTAALQDGAVTGPKLANGAVGTAKLAANALSADTDGREKMADGYLTTAKMANGALSADVAGRAKMADEFVTTPKLAEGALSADADGREKMADGYLSADTAGRAKMADKFVTLAKLQDVATAILLGRDTAGSGPVEELSVAEVRALIASAIGQALLTAADAAAGRAAIAAQPLSQASAGVGQEVTISATAGNGLVLPTGGEWSWWAARYQSGTGIWAGNIVDGIATGGTTVISGIGGVVFTGRAKRIA